MAYHYYPLRILRFEVLGMAGSFSGNPTYAASSSWHLDLGWLKLKGGVGIPTLEEPTPEQPARYNP